MGWAENRVEDYQCGLPATWFERRALEHANPVYLVLALAAGAGLGYGLWMHDWVAIGAGALLGLSGHVWCWTRRPALSERGRRYSRRHVDLSEKYRAGLLVRALSWYGSHGRARRAASAGDQRGGRAQN